ncbi:hypothetical protein LC087_10350 [Bacillus carboniphilus]|uniref:Uncharacterized protein n=1 Tax=Bacillus carboniphilus TaxID=86663 RepID=A0ABY9JUG7_9BACI|nr:hypothetical protein [Bacillus carboniphilus]WLR41326.1 hypothetical protein LC087_10350 [Bacillus carboniphilus]
MEKIKHIIFVIIFIGILGIIKKFLPVLFNIFWLGSWIVIVIFGVFRLKRIFTTLRANELNKKTIREDIFMVLLAIVATYSVWSAITN